MYISQLTTLIGLSSFLLAIIAVLGVLLAKKGQSRSTTGSPARLGPYSNLSLLSDMGMFDKSPENRPELNDILAGLSGAALQVPGYKGLDVETVTRAYESKPAGGLFTRRGLPVGALTGLLVVLLGALVMVAVNSRKRAEMVLIPAGEFRMGSNDRYDDEEPVHTVYLDAFYIDRYEVTNARYAEFLNSEGNQSEGGYTWLDIGDEDCLIEKGTWGT